ncbi:hypothetical protein F441_00873 [Phytophthora nicotianae CJ01A1]|uniref:Secreted protein n=1 Tax=Phytophthora nicotianae CJ01A1 TaxID=1317063 RepID=W2XU68_PHYNI|nr:hypothetical protein F441_00873 [Phytophthora nicotianae CJ01A1]
MHRISWRTSPPKAVPLWLLLSVRCRVLSKPLSCKFQRRSLRSVKLLPTARNSMMATSSSHTHRAAPFLALSSKKWTTTKSSATSVWLVSRTASSSDQTRLSTLSRTMAHS